ncbi:MAG TPA: hypothetical protein VH643_16555 [Gemmataceae bacterium]|jgi:hypothetical protein
MFSLRGSWFSRDTVPRAPRRLLPPPSVEPLEDRLAPSAGLLFWLMPKVEERSSDHPWIAREAPLRSEARNWDSIREDVRRDDDANHPFLATLAARADGLNLGGGRLLSALIDLNAVPAAPVVPLGTVLASTSQMPPVEKSPSLPMPISASASAAASQGSVAYLPKRPATGDALGFPTFNPSVRKPAGKDRPLNFALSPFDPSGLDIVPMPVPRGLEEKLADLLGDPQLAPRDTSTDDVLGAANDRDQAAFRDAVRQMLQEGSTFSRTGPQRADNLAPLTAAESSPPNTATDDIFSAGTPLDPTSDDAAEETGVSPATRSVLAFLAAGAGLVGQWTAQREPRPRRHRC